MSEWKGLDAGGTEQLWDMEVLKGALEILQTHEPFSRGDPESPIYPDLESQYPEITWSNSDGESFRPVFRKTNPWVKLGLTTGETEDAYLTPTGYELLSGEKSLEEVYVEATKNHQEPDGEYSFAIMCRAALEAPTQSFTLEDVEYGISRAYADGNQTLSEAINQVRTKKIQFPQGSRRVRTLRSFMNALVSSGALVNDAIGWRLADLARAREIAQIQLGQTTGSVVALEPVPLKKVRRVVSPNIKTIESGARGVAPFSPTTSNTYDPVQRALLLEKANSLHELMVELCASDVRKNGGNPLEDQNSFDVAETDLKIILEIKSVTQANAISQARKAVAQLLEYRYRHREMFAQSPALFLVTNENLTDFVDEEFIDFLVNDQKINLFSLSDGAIVSSEGVVLAEFLARPS